MSAPALILSRPRWRFGSFAATGKGTRRPQAAESPLRKSNQERDDPNGTLLSARDRDRVSRADQGLAGRAPGEAGPACVGQRALLPQEDGGEGGDPPPTSRAGTTCTSCPSSARPTRAISESLRPGGRPPEGLRAHPVHLRHHRQAGGGLLHPPRHRPVGGLLRPGPLWPAGGTDEDVCRCPTATACSPAAPASTAAATRWAVSPSPPPPATPSGRSCSSGI